LTRPEVPDDHTAFVERGEQPITLLLRAWALGDEAALDRLVPVIYDHLHRLAAAAMRRERPGHTLSPTALVAEAFLRLAGGEHPTYDDRVQFFALAALQMRRVLVDHARRRAAGKRGGGDRPVTFDEGLYADDRPDELVQLDDALAALAAVDERKARVVELHYFGGMGHKEIGAALSVHESTVARDLHFAEAWLHRHMTSPS
jgi:RNA polymerase sigma factor (TIGR02999 family)